jgi:hypothetical protein
MFKMYYTNSLINASTECIYHISHTVHEALISFLSRSSVVVSLGGTTVVMIAASKLLIHTNIVSFSLTSKTASPSFALCFLVTASPQRLLSTDCDDVLTVYYRN